MLLRLGCLGGRFAGFERFPAERPFSFRLFLAISGQEGCFQNSIPQFRGDIIAERPVPARINRPQTLIESPHRSILLPAVSFLRDSASVTWQDLSLDWRMTWASLLALTFMALGMKTIVLLFPGVLVARSWRFILSPVLAPGSIARSQPLSAVPAFFRHAGLVFGALVFYYWIYWQLVPAFHLHGLVLQYLVAPAVVLLMEAVVAIVTVLWLPDGRLLPGMHRHPWAARSVADFWGRRWNLWMSEWFREVIFQRMRRHPALAMWLVFGLSGLLHEYGLNLTLWLVTGRNLFGTMMIYFLLQAVGLQLERRFLRNYPRVNVAFTWLVVFVPAPLVFHESMLRSLHLWPG